MERERARCGSRFRLKKKKVKIPEVLLYEIFSWGWGSRLLLELILEPKPPNQVLHTDTEIFLFELSSESSAAFMGDAYGVDTETPLQSQD